MSNVRGGRLVIGDMPGSRRELVRRHLHAVSEQPEATYLVFGSSDSWGHAALEAVASTWSPTVHVSAEDPASLLTYVVGEYQRYANATSHRHVVELAVEVMALQERVKLLERAIGQTQLQDPGFAASVDWSSAGNVVAAYGLLGVYDVARGLVADLFGADATLVAELESDAGSRGPVVVFRVEISASQRQLRNIFLERYVRETQLPPGAPAPVLFWSYRDASSA